MTHRIGAFLNDYPGTHYKPWLKREAEALGCEVCFYDYLSVKADDLAGCDILFGHVPAVLLRELEGLKWYCNCWAGMDAYCDADFKKSPGCIVTNASGAYGLMIAEHVVMGLLMLLHRQREYDALMAAGEWHKVDGVISTLRGRRVTLLGTGDIGRETAKRLRPFGVASITGISRSGSEAPFFDAVYPVTDLDAILKETDVLICAVPGTAETKGMLSEERLSLLPKGAYLVNVGRGSLLDQGALVEMLTDGCLSGAVIDVTVPEPLPEDHPLRLMQNVILTPHISGSLNSLPYTCTKTVEMFLEDLRHFVQGEDLSYVASVQKGY